MGMFDSFKVAPDNVLNIPLPKDEYQSKDLDCLLLDYLITEDGKLTVEPLDNDGEKVSPIWAASYESYVSDPSNKAYDIATGRFSGDIEIYGNVEKTGNWEEYRLLIQNNEILFVLNYGEIIYTSDPESNDDFMRTMYPPAEMLTVDPSTTPIQQRVLSTKHLAIPSYTVGHPTTTDINQMLNKLGLDSTTMMLTGASKLAGGQLIQYKRPTVNIPENHMVLFTHVDENKTDVIHFVTHHNVISYNDLMVIVTDQDGNELERHDTLWKLRTARGTKAIEEGRRNTFDIFVANMLNEYGSTAFLYPTLIKPLAATAHAVISETALAHVRKDPKGKE